MEQVHKRLASMRKQATELLKKKGEELSSQTAKVGELTTHLNEKVTALWALGDTRGHCFMGTRHISTKR